MPRRPTKDQRRAVREQLKRLVASAHRKGIEVDFRCRRDDLIVESILREGGTRLFTISKGRSFPLGWIADREDPRRLVGPVVLDMVNELVTFRAHHATEATR